MASYGSTTYTDPDDFRANVSSAVVDLVLTGSEPFKAQVTWLKQRRLTLVSVEQTTSHITFLSLDPARIYVSFPLRGESVMNGVRVGRGDFMIHARGERVHHLAEASTRWGMISMRAKELEAHGHALLHKELDLPEESQLVRPPRKTASEIMRLHAQACRFAASRPDMMSHREVARSVEQHLTVLLVNIIAGSERLCHANRRRVDIMGRFQAALTRQSHPQRLSGLCTAIDVPPRTLRICCEAFLARGPAEYMRLRRLNRARSALFRADHETASIAGIARSHGFTEPGRFAGAYRALFGETPSTTLLRNSAESA
jgi:AraC family ethanolamine operon transcriptional activator